MPSGHATAAFAGFIFLALYFNAQLKLLSAHNPAYWKMLLFMAPILAAILIAMAMNMDGYHHWYDVTIGGLIGTACAFVAFRSTFASIWDFRFNHVLLPRTSSLFLRRGYQGDGAGAPAFDYVPGASGQWPVSREGGWNEAFELSGGAPFDASTTGGMGAMGAMGGAGRMGGNTGNYGNSGFNGPNTHITNRTSGDASTQV
jgi:hypothetical protein